MHNIEFTTSDHLRCKMQPPEVRSLVWQSPHPAPRTFLSSHLELRLSFLCPTPGTYLLLPVSRDLTVVGASYQWGDLFVFLCLVYFFLHCSLYQWPPLQDRTIVPCMCSLYSVYLFVYKTGPWVASLLWLVWRMALQTPVHSYLCNLCFMFGDVDTRSSLTFDTSPYVFFKLPTDGKQYH